MFDKKLPLQILIVSLALALYQPVWSMGLKASGEIFFDNVKIGKKYRLSEHKKKFYRVTASEQAQAQIALDITLPVQGDKLPEGFEALPELKWLKLSESRFPLEPGIEKSIDIELALPKNRNFAGKKYFAFIWARSIAQENTFALSIAVKSKLYITVSR